MNYVIEEIVLYKKETASLLFAKRRQKKGKAESRYKGMKSLSHMDVYILAISAMVLFA